MCIRDRSQPTLLPDHLLWHPEGGGGRRAAQRPAEGARDRLPSGRLRRQGLLLLPGYARPCLLYTSRRITPATVREKVGPPSVNWILVMLDVYKRQTQYGQKPLASEA